MLHCSTPKHEVACELLDRAIELFLRGDSYYSALHLGGAAEELLSVYARETHATSSSMLVPAFDQMKEAVVALCTPCTEYERTKADKWVHNRMMDAKNSVKHMRGVRDSYVEFDAPEEAYDVIDRAITTYFQLLSPLRLPHLPSIPKFDAKRRFKRMQ